MMIGENEDEEEKEKEEVGNVTRVTQHRSSAAATAQRWSQETTHCTELVVLAMAEKRGAESGERSCEAKMEEEEEEEEEEREAGRSAHCRERSVATKHLPIPASTASRFPLMLPAPSSADPASPLTMDVRNIPVLQKELTSFFSP